MLWYTIRKHRSISYIVSDRVITIVEGGFSQNIDIANIRKVETGAVRFGVGSIILKTNSREAELIGLENPDQLRKLIEITIEAELQRIEGERQTKPAEPKFTPGTMDRIDYLTGLWQQGLISEEDYENERKNFESS